MRTDSIIYVAGHRGMVGSAIVRALEKAGYSKILKSTTADLDLKDQKAVNDFFKREKPQYVFLAAAKVGGIQANNTNRAEFLYDNLLIEANVIHAAYQTAVTKLLFLGSSCIYPKLAPQPLKEEYLLTGPLEPTNEAYAIAKIAGIKMCEYYRHQYGCNFISAMPTNLYGINDKYDLEKSHVLPALIRKFHEAKTKNHPSVEIWGTGKPLREFMFADDLADACLHLMRNYNEAGFVNIGTGEEVTIETLANLIKAAVGYQGELIFNTNKPDGTPRKLLDTSKLKASGYSHQIKLQEGIAMAYQDFLSNHN
jgi:GDP-L-fucose synthase